jgi:hypothetical protein
MYRPLPPLMITIKADLAARRAGKIASGVHCQLE